MCPENADRTETNKASFQLENSIGKIAAYLDKKQTDFARDKQRRDDPGNQKWEQRRIRSALHGFDTLRTLQGSRRQSEASRQRDEKVEVYKTTLLSEPSKRIFENENSAKEAGDGGIRL